MSSSLQVNILGDSYFSFNLHLFLNFQYWWHNSKGNSFILNWKNISTSNMWQGKICSLLFLSSRDKEETSCVSYIWYQFIMIEFPFNWYYQYLEWRKLVNDNKQLFPFFLMILFNDIKLVTDIMQRMNILFPPYLSFRASDHFNFCVHTT